MIFLQGIFGRQANISCLAAYTVYGAKVKNAEYDVQGAIRAGCPLRIYIIIMYIKQQKIRANQDDSPFYVYCAPKDAIRPKCTNRQRTLLAVSVEKHKDEK